MTAGETTSSTSAFHQLFWGSIGALLLVVALVLTAALVVTYLQTGLVPRFPTAILTPA